MSLTRPGGFFGFVRGTTCSAYLPSGTRGETAEPSARDAAYDSAHDSGHGLASCLASGLGYDPC